MYKFELGQQVFFAHSDNSMARRPRQHTVVRRFQEDVGGGQTINFYCLSLDEDRLIREAELLAECPPLQNLPGDQERITFGVLGRAASLLTDENQNDNQDLHDGPSGQDTERSSPDGEQVVRQRKTGRLQDSGIRGSKDSGREPAEVSG